MEPLQMLWTVYRQFMMSQFKMTEWLHRFKDSCESLKRMASNIREYEDNVRHMQKICTLIVIRQTMAEAF
jgi:chlorite dismutase